MFVGVTAARPEERFRRLISGRRFHRLVTPYGVALRPDLSDHLPAFEEREEARKAQRVLMRELRRRGFTVNGSFMVWRVYVIELSDEVGPRKCPDKPWVYVGQTSLTPEERFRQHLEEARTVEGQPRFSRVVHRHGVRLLPELYLHLPPCYLQEDALQLEAEVARDLAAQCYSVKGGH